MDKKETEIGDIVEIKEKMYALRPRQNASCYQCDLYLPGPIPCCLFPERLSIVQCGGGLSIQSRCSGGVYKQIKPPIEELIRTRSDKLIELVDEHFKLCDSFEIEYVDKKVDELCEKHIKVEEAYHNHTARSIPSGVRIGDE